MLNRTKLLWRALPLAFATLFASSALAFAEPAAAPPALDSAAVDVQPQWTAYGFHITAPTDMWPMLEMLHAYHFDWELYSAQDRPTPLTWAPLPNGVYGQYVPSKNILKLSSMLQNESTELATAFLAHELTHLTDDINGKLGDMTGDACYGAETRAFVNEANFWEMVNGATGKVTSDWLEQQENNKMFAFVGNSNFADLVLRTTPSYIKQCGTGN
ncbi:MAG: hypothetical protein JO020_21220 [Chloroflexi bacterium]|nr:hypothetical protein [Chloroflexota bacterium]